MMLFSLLFLCASGVTGWTTMGRRHSMPTAPICQKMCKPSRLLTAGTNVEKEMPTPFLWLESKSGVSCNMLVAALALGMLTTVATALPALAAEDRGWDLYTTTTPTTGMFAPPTWQQRQARDALRRNQDFQDERLSQCIDRGSLWELCYWYGVRDGDATSDIVAPSTSSQESSTTATSSSLTLRRPPTW